MRAAVLGSPIAHSLSPALHAAAHEALGLAGWEYGLAEVDAEGLAPFVAALGPEWAGLSLTMPLKAAVLPLLAGASPLAMAVGAVNTVLPADGAQPLPGARRAWRGENTDVHGIVAALAEAGVARVGTAAVLGGGSTAASAVAALRQLGAVRPVVHVRSAARAAGLLAVAERLGAQPVLAPWPTGDGVATDAGAVAGLAAADVVVSTAPAGAADGLAAALAAPGAPRPRGVLLDVVYAPWPTPLARAWEGAGGAVVSGFAMLLHQAGEQVRLMTGLPAPLEAMRAAGERALAERSRG